MDRSFNSSLLNNRSPFSPRSRTNIAAKRAIGNSSFRKSSRFSVSGRSTQSVQVVLKTQSNSVERFGQALPVLVTEALTFSDRNAVVSARIASECGYAWLVCGRRLLIWQYRQSPVLQAGTPRRAVLTNQCHELQLPQSDLAHRAELISVFISGSGGASCIAVSPEGVLRFWPAIAHEGVFTEQSVDLQGQECDSLTAVENLGCILATTTCTVVLVQTHLSAGRHNLTCHTLKMPSGWLGGLSKKMSSLIFGPISSEQSTETRIVRVLSVPLSNNNYNIFVLAGHSLQKWHLSDTERLVYVSDLIKLVRDGFHGTVWDSADPTDTDTWILDLQFHGENVVLLTMAVNLRVSPQVHYAAVSIEMGSAQPPTQFTSFQLLKINGLYREESLAENLNYRLLISGSNVYVYNHRCIYVVKPQEEPDCLEFNSPQDFLLGGSICVNTPVFFSRNHGLVSVSGSDLASDFSVFSPGTPAESSFSEGAIENLTLYNFNPEEMFAAYKDTVGQLKAAFVFHLKNDFAACKDILQQLFLTEGSCLPGVDTVLDKVVSTVSKDLLDDIPANDPRWLGENQVGLGSSCAMQVLQQLQDKQKAHQLYVKFLKETELWKKLTATTVRNAPVATAHLIAENSEKIAAAVALKEMPAIGNVLAVAIDRATRDTDVDMDNGLTTIDVFFRELTKVQGVLQELVNHCDEIIHSDMSPTEAAKIINETNSVILNVLKEVMQYRQQNSTYFAPNETALEFAPDFLPWTSATGFEGLMDCLLIQQNLTYKYGAKATSEYNLTTSLYDQFVALVDLILDARKCYIESIRGASYEDVHVKQYQTDRRKLISPLIVEKQWDGAAVLSEKYLDFECLVQICEATDNQARLNEYMERFSAEGFAQFVYTWYLQQNKQGKLIELCRRFGTSTHATHTQELGKFLSQHPSLSWIQNAFDGKFHQAAETLKTLSYAETEVVTRQKTMLSMAKLAELAAGANEQSLADLNDRLEVIAYQEDLPDYVLQQFGYDTIKPRVISPKDMIHLYVCPEYRDSTEIEFKKALDLLNFVDDDETRDELNLHVWRSAILRDTWNDRNLDAPLDVLSHKLMFKTADLALVLGADPQNLLPPIDSLLEGSEMIELRDKRNFVFLLRTGYEHISKVMQVN